MMEDDDNSSIQRNRLVERFRQGSILYHNGRELAVKSMEDEGGDEARAAWRDLEALGPDGHLALAPLLEDPNPDIAVMAAMFLFDDLPEKSVPVLKAIYAQRHSEAAMSASRFLWFNGYRD
jgi:hypothetical protein